MPSCTSYPTLAIINPIRTPIMPRIIDARVKDATIVSPAIASSAMSAGSECSATAEIRGTKLTATIQLIMPPANDPMAE